MKISIITIVKNNVDFVADCVKSVVSQTYGGIEYIIVDGGSTDGTLNALGPYKDKITKVISEKDAGRYYAMNIGLNLASGDVVGFLHADDFYADTKVIEKVTDVFKEGSIDSVYGDLVYVQKNPPHKTVRYWHAGGYDIKKIENGWMPPHPALFVKREIYRKYGTFNTGFTIASDYEIMLRFLYKHKISARYIPEVLVKMRMGGVSNRGFDNIIRKTMEDYKVCKLHGMERPFATIVLKNIAKIPQFFVKQVTKDDK